MFTDFLIDAGACIVGVSAVGAGSKLAKGMAARREAKKVAEVQDSNESTLNQAAEAIKAAFTSKQVVQE